MQSTLWINVMWSLDNNHKECLSNLPYGIAISAKLTNTSVLPMHLLKWTIDLILLGSNQFAVNSTMLNESFQDWNNVQFENKILHYANLNESKAKTQQRVEDKKCPLCNYVACNELFDRETINDLEIKSSWKPIFILHWIR